MEPVNLPIHFGNLQGKHEINSDSLLVLIESYKEIAALFGLDVEIQIGIPEEGGWKTTLAVTGVVISFIGINPISILLTGETSEEWAKKGREFIIQKVNEFVTTEAAELPDELPRDCIKSKNKIYRQFQNDKCIDSFRMGSFPPIPKNNFYLYIKKLPDEEHIYLGETDITVSSPDWKGKRSWRGKIEIVEDTESAFAFDKDLTGKFWEKVKIDALPLHTKDVMRVQLVKRPTNKVKYLVIRVLSYNDEVIDLPIEDDSIRRIYGIAASLPATEEPTQLSLL
ncbi:MAG: hypothetical protein ACTH58_08660 [Marinomonas foliarum]|uniref:Uncharacterized protein n=1 Tax=Marinomonas foliarum TaxID=491950 RepID=A0A368ZVC3_9GAMM|nr:hypothetical protein [Marinomonas foliarum]RCX00952.1 hypothetical protein DFP77_12028 [Marinomonas foliarum]